MSKGSHTRPFDRKGFGEAFDRIFGKGSAGDIGTDPESKEFDRQTRPESPQKPSVEGDH